MYTYYNVCKCKLCTTTFSLWRRAQQEKMQCTTKTNPHLPLFLHHLRYLLVRDQLLLRRPGAVEVGRVQADAVVVRGHGGALKGCEGMSVEWVIQAGIIGVDSAVKLMLWNQNLGQRSMNDFRQQSIHFFTRQIVFCRFKFNVIFSSISRGTHKKRTLNYIPFDFNQTKSPLSIN